jgi:hypothetical protein
MTTAQMFFSSVFRKRLPPPPKFSHPQPEADQGPRNRLQEAIPNNHGEACDMFTGQVGNSSKTSDGNPVLDLEQLLKQKTFTRSESDTLMALLRSRTVELPAEPEDKTQKNPSLSASDLKNKDVDKSQGILSPSIINSIHNEDNVFSPSHLAKVHMGKVSPSVSGSNDQGLREKSTFTNNQALVLTSKSPNLLSQSLNTSGGIGVRDNGLSIKQYRGRSAIYNMARSPYFGVHSTSTPQKGSRFMNDVFNGTPPSSSRRVWENGGTSHFKRAGLKRVSSAFEDDGAIRRVRQKPNLSSQGRFGNGVAYLENHASSSSLQKPLSPNEANDNNTTKSVEENRDVIHYPPKSSATGKQILQHLETKTPKQKSSEFGLVMGGSEKSAPKLTSNMLSGQALKSLEHVDSAKFKSLERVDPQSSRVSEDLEKDTVEKNGTPEMLMDTRNTLASSVHVDTDVKNASFNTTGAENNDDVADPPLKRRAFQMSALEDFVELDEDMSSDEPKLAQPVQEEKEKSVVTKTVPTEESLVEKSPALNIPIPSKEITKVEENGNGAVVVSANEKNGFTFSTPAAPPVLSTNNNNDHTESISASAPAKDSNDSLPVFNADKVPSVTFLPPPALSEPKSSSPFALKPEALSRLENISSGTTDAQLKVTASDTDVGKNKDNNEVKQNGGDTNGTVDTVNSAVLTSPSTNGMFSFTAMTKTSNSDNVSQTSTPSVFPSTFPAFPSTNQTSDNIFAQPISSPSTMFASTATTTTAAITTTTTTAATTTTAVPSLPAEPIFKFGSSLAPPTPTTSIAETTDSKAKPESKPIFGNGGSSPFTSGSSNLFGLSSSITTPTVNNQSPAPPLFGTNGGSIITTQPSSSSGITSFTSGSSLFSPAPSLSGTDSVSTSVNFGSTWKQPDKAPTFPNPFTSPNQSGGFSFGAPSNSATATNTAPTMIFGQSTGSSSGSAFSFGSSTGPASGPAFPFGSSTSSSAGAVFSFGSSTTAAPTSTTPSLLPQAQPIFGANPVFNASSANNNQMSMEDSMAEDPVQAAPTFGQQPLFSNPTGLMFGSTPPAQAPANPFQFGGNQNPSAPSFQASGSVEFNAGGSFSLGSGAGDKSSRRTVRVNKNRNRKK